VKNSEPDDFDKARQYAFLLLKYRDRGEKEIVQRLQKKGFTEETGFRVRDYLKERGFIDDAKFAEGLRRSAVEQRRFGRSGVVAYLVSKGISAEMAVEVAGEDSDYEGAAAEIVRRKMNQCEGIDGPVVKRRIWATLARKGFSADVIKRALKNCYDSEDFCL
jgi:regulatory protein